MGGFFFDVGGGINNKGGSPSPFQLNYGDTLQQAPLLLTEQRLNRSVAYTPLGHFENFGNFKKMAKSKKPQKWHLHNSGWTSLFFGPAHFWIFQKIFEKFWKLSKIRHWILLRWEDAFFLFLRARLSPYPTPKPNEKALKKKCMRKIVYRHQ